MAAKLEALQVTNLPRSLLEGYFADKKHPPP